MIKPINIGVGEDGARFALPLELTTQSLAVLAKRGAGKTFTAAVITEELLTAGQQVVAIDPTGAWYGLKSSADGNREGFPVVVFGGDHPDLPLDEHSGEIIARALVEHKFSAVLDLSLFRKGEFTRFMAVFLETLYRLNRDPLHLVCDEADAYAPQKPFGDQARTLGAMEDIVRRGRKKGIGCTLISQRPSVLNKNVLTQCEMLIAMRLVHPRDIDAIQEWVAVHGDEELAKRMIASLPSLPIGTAWVWSPGWGDLFARVKIRPRSTFDSSATPKPGESVKAPKRVASIDLAALGAEIADTAQRAKANDPATLRKEIGMLKTELERAKRAEPAPQPKPEEVPVLTDEDRHRLGGITTAITAMMADLAGAVARMKSLDEKVSLLSNDIQSRARPDFRNRPVMRVDFTDGKQPPVVVRHALRPMEANGSSEVGTGGVRRMLIALAQRPFLTRRQLGVRARLSSKSGTFDTYLARLRTNGWIENGGDAIGITEAGRSALGKFDPLPEGQELLSHWLNELGSGGASRMLRVLSEAYPKSLTRQELGERATISSTSGTFDTYLARLRTLELVHGRGELKASDEFFS